MRKLAVLAVLAGPVTFAGCDRLSQAMTSHTDVLAKAAGHELTVEQATQLLAPQVRIPAQAEVVDAIANLWVDYTLLATAAAQDSTLTTLELDPIIDPHFNQQLVYQLRDRVVQVDTAITDAELRALFAQEQPDARVHARHILLQLPQDASPHMQDSVTTLAGQIRERAVGGADFARLAAEYSQEPGAADRGGDLGFFGRGDMVAAFEEAAFAMEAGEISQPVQTPFGLHIIKVEAKETPTFDEVQDTFRAQMVQRRHEQAEERYLTQLTEQRNVVVQESAVDVARELARKPATSLSRRAGGRALVEYNGGSLSAAEYLRLMQARPANQRGQVAAANDDQLEEWLKLLARDEILVDEAQKLGIVTDSTERETARVELRQQLVEAARVAGLIPIVPLDGESRGDAVQRHVLAYMSSVLGGEQQVLPLGPLGFALRDTYGSEIYERAVPTVVNAVEIARPADAAPQQPLPQQQPVPESAGADGGQ